MTYNMNTNPNTDTNTTADSNTENNDNKLQKCNTNPVGKYLRIAASLIIIGIGIYTKNPLGVLGLYTLYTAFTGKCNAGGIPFGRKNDYRLR